MVVVHREARARVIVFYGSRVDCEERRPLCSLRVAHRDLRRHGHDELLTDRTAQAINCVGDGAMKLLAKVNGYICIYKYIHIYTYFMHMCSRLRSTLTSGDDESVAKGERTVSFSRLRY